MRVFFSVLEVPSFFLVKRESHFHLGLVLISGQLSSYNSTLSIDSSASPYSGTSSAHVRTAAAASGARGDPAVFAVISGQGQSRVQSRARL